MIAGSKFKNRILLIALLLLLSSSVEFAVHQIPIKDAEVNIPSISKDYSVTK
jgi:hypothetical protein